MLPLTASFVPGSVLRDLVRVWEHVRDHGHRVPPRGSVSVAIGERGHRLSSPLLRLHPRRVNIRQRVLTHIGHYHSHLSCNR